MLQSAALKLPGIRHGFFTRAGGVSQGVYESLNGGVGSHDAADKVAENPDDLPAAFRAYVQQRYLRTARVQIMARVYGDFYHARGPAAELRNQMLASRTPEESYDGIAWLYGGM